MKFRSSFLLRNYYNWSNYKFSKNSENAFKGTVVNDGSLETFEKKCSPSIFWIYKSHDESTLHNPVKKLQINV